MIPQDAPFWSRVTVNDLPIIHAYVEGLSRPPGLAWEETGTQNGYVVLLSVHLEHLTKLSCLNQGLAIYVLWSWDFAHAFLWSLSLCCHREKQQLQDLSLRHCGEKQQLSPSAYSLATEWGRSGLQPEKTAGLNLFQARLELKSKSPQGINLYILSLQKQLFLVPSSW